MTAASPMAFRRHIVPLLAGPSLVLLTACTTTAPASTPPQPTATRAAPTAAPGPAAVLPSPSPGASPIASPSPAPAALIEITDATLADATPWVSLRLSDGEPRIVSGWRLEVGNHGITIPGNAILQPGQTLILRAGDGLSSDREIFLGPDSHPLALAAAPGTRVRLVNEAGVVVAETTVPRF